MTTIIRLSYHIPLLLLCLSAGCTKWALVDRRDPMVATLYNGPAEHDRVVQPYHYRVFHPGRYSLYRATKWGKHDIPQDATLVATCDLNYGDSIKSVWTDISGNVWFGYHGTDLITEAGGQQFHLGKAEQPTRYYWAFEDYWGEYWRQKPVSDTLSLIVELPFVFILSGRAQ